MPSKNVGYFDYILNIAIAYIFKTKYKFLYIYVNKILNSYLIFAFVKQSERTLRNRFVNV